MRQIIKNNDGVGNNNKKMGSIQLEERIESSIRSLIAKHPKIQFEIFHLRDVFVDSVKSFNKEYWKMVRKYEKLKENLNAKEEQLSINQQKNSMKKISFSTKPSCDYGIDLMSLVLSEAKSIKSIFQQSLQSSVTYQSKHQTIKSSTFINIYNAYKDFYQSFKRRHKDYIKNYSYDQKHIHQNSTAMKQRLIDQLQKEIWKRHEIQQKYSALKHKYHQIQTLKTELQQHQNQKQMQLQNKISQLCCKCKVLFENQISQDLLNEKLFEEQKQSEMKKSWEYRMTFGNQKLQNRNNKKEKIQKHDQINDNNDKLLQNQTQILIKELQKQKNQNQKLNQKQKQSEAQYNRLQDQVNELYKLMRVEQIGGYYNGNMRQKKENSYFFQEQTEKEKLGYNQLLMILLTQASSLEEFIHKQQQNQSSILV